MPRYIGVKYEKIADEDLSITTCEGEKKTLKADTYIVAIPMLPDQELIQKLSATVKKSYAVGSCVNGGLMVDAVGDGARVGYLNL